MEKKSFLWLIIFVFLIFVSFYFDRQISELIVLARINLFNDFFLGLTYASSLIIFLFLTTLFLWHDRKRKWIFPLWLTLFLSGILSFFLKIIIRRQRPFEIYSSIIALQQAVESSFYSWNFSFPSLQSMIVFSAIPILNKEFPRFKYLWIIFACLVAFSRVYFGVHFMSDVIFGGLIGYLLGLLIVKQEKEYKFGEKIYKKIIKK